MRYLFVLLMLTGCATAEDRAVREAAYIARVESRCVALGFSAGTEAAAFCKLQLIQSDRADRRAGQAAAAAAYANTTSSMQGQQQIDLQRQQQMFGR